MEDTEEESLYKALTKLTKNLTNDCQTIAQKGHNEEYTEATSSAVACLAKLQDLLMFSEDEHRFLLLESCRVVNTTVVELIKASKINGTNVYDVKPQKRLNTSTLLVLESIRSFLSFVEIAEQTTNHVLSTNESGTSLARIHSTPPEGLDPNFKLFLGSIKKIKEAANGGHEANLSEEIKHLEDSSSLILQKYTKKENSNVHQNGENEEYGEKEKDHERATQITLLAERLRLATISLINCAKLLFGNPKNHSFVAQFDKEANDVAKTILTLAELTDDEYLPF